MGKLIGGMILVWFAFSVIENIHDAIAGFGDVNVYQKSCIDMKQDAFECTRDNGGIHISKTVYRVDFKNQRVISKSVLFNNTESCVVFDKDNWSCKYGDKGITTMTDGRYSSTSDAEFKDKKMFFYYAPSFAVNYWFEYLRGFF